jgi:23S rRNA pseudouridine1911/1915/1917 synthase
MEKGIEIIFEDENILVLNKPFGLVVNRSNTYKDLTLQDILDARYLKQSDVVDEEFVRRSGIVHRLDKDTSGVIVVAKNPDSFYFLQRQFKERRTFKEYIAIVHGKVGDEVLEIDAPIARNPKNPLKIAIVSDGKNAFTRVEKVKIFNKEDVSYTFCKIFPKTGRTHQIRVHLSAVGHPVAGDVVYCAKNLLGTDEKAFGRMMLHAHFLGFSNPQTNKFQRFEAPLPREFQI